MSRTYALCISVTTRFKINHILYNLPHILRMRKNMKYTYFIPRAFKLFRVNVLISHVYNNV